MPLEFNDMSRAAAGAKQNAFPELGEGRETDLCVYAIALYRALVDDIATALSALDRLMDEPTVCLRLCGGGGQDALLCQMLADRTGINVLAGPIEASAWGNAALQLIGLGLIKDLPSARSLIEKSTTLQTYHPQAEDK